MRWIIYITAAAAAAPVCIPHYAATGFLDLVAGQQAATLRRC
jgi:hypothetical protein